MSADSGADARLFESRHLAADVKNLAVRGGILKMASQGVRFGLRIAGLIVMARLVPPAETGVYAMSAAFMGLVAWFRDMGLTMATVQRAEINHALISTLFWINVAIGLGLAAMTALAAPLLSWFYGEPRLTMITLAIGGTYILAGLGAQHQALLQRHMRFGVLESINIAAQLAGAAAMLVSAWYGAGAWSFVLNLVVLHAVLTVLMWAFAGWRPGLPRRNTGARSMLRFGRDLSGYHLVNYVHHHLDNILIGRFCGPEALGFYVKAYGLLKIPLIQVGDPLSNVVLPALSRLQDDPVRFRGYFLKALRGVLLAGMPVVAFTFVEAREIVLMLLGARWLPVVPIFQALAPAAFLALPHMVSNWLFTSLGRTDRQFRSGTGVMIVAAAAFGVGLPWNATGVAAAYSAAYCLLILPTLAYAAKGTPVSLGDLGRSIWPPTAVAVLCAAVMLPLKSALPLPEAPVVRFVVHGALYSLFYAGAWAATQAGRDFVRGVARPVVEAARNFLARRRSA